MKHFWIVVEQMNENGTKYRAWAQRVSQSDNICRIACGRTIAAVTIAGSAKEAERMYLAKNEAYKRNGNFYEW